MFGAIGTHYHNYFAWGLEGTVRDFNRRDPVAPQNDDSHKQKSPP